MCVVKSSDILVNVHIYSFVFTVVLYPVSGPFLSAVFGRLEGMVQNSLYANLLLTGLVSRLAAYPHPLLRSFLLNVNLVFQPTVKSLVQVGEIGAERENVKC